MILPLFFVFYPLLRKICINLVEKLLKNLKIAKEQPISAYATNRYKTQNGSKKLINILLGKAYLVIHILDKKKACLLKNIEFVRIM